jgi:hypothetical protein
LHYLVGNVHQISLQRRSWRRSLCKAYITYAALGGVGFVKVSQQHLAAAALMFGISKNSLHFAAVVGLSLINISGLINIHIVGMLARFNPGYLRLIGLGQSSLAG